MYISLKLAGTSCSFGLTQYNNFFFYTYSLLLRVSSGAAVKLCLGDLLVMDSNLETAYSLLLIKND